MPDVFPELATVASHPRSFFTPDELAPLLGMDPQDVREAIDRGDLPGRKLKHRYRIPRVAVYRFLRGEWPGRQRRLVTVERVKDRIDARVYLRAYRR